MLFSQWKSLYTNNFVSLKPHKTGLVGGPLLTCGRETPTFYIHTKMSKSKHCRCNKFSRTSKLEDGSASRQCVPLGEDGVLHESCHCCWHQSPVLFLGGKENKTAFLKQKSDTNCIEVNRNYSC